MEKRELKSLLGRDINKVFKYLLDSLDADNDVFNQLILLQARYNDNVKNRRLDIEDKALIDTERNNIIYKLLQIIDEIEEISTKEESPIDWWDRIPLVWENALLDYFSIELPSRNKEIRYLWDQKSLVLDSEEIDTLEPLRAFKSIVDLDLNLPSVKDYSHLGELKKLEQLTIQSAKGIDLSFLLRLGLKQLYLKNVEVELMKTFDSSKIESLEFDTVNFKIGKNVVMNFSSLASLKIKSCQNINLNFLAGKKINFLSVLGTAILEQDNILDKIEIQSIECSWDSGVLNPNNIKHLKKLEFLSVYGQYEPNLLLDEFLYTELPHELNLVDVQYEIVVQLINANKFNKITYKAYLSADLIKKIETDLQDRPNIILTKKSLAPKSSMLKILGKNERYHIEIVRNS